MQADLAWRRDRDEQLAAPNTDSSQPDGPPPH